MSGNVKVLLDKTAQFRAAIDMMSKSVYVGVPAEAQSRSGKVGNADLAYIHDKGSPANNIPARPFMEPGINSAQGQIEKTLKDGASIGFSNPEAIGNSLNKVGLLAQSAIKKSIVSGEGFAPLSESTLKARVRRKVTRTKPLIDTGSLLNSISYAIK